jgi:hypothetical protein
MYSGLLVPEDGHVLLREVDDSEVACSPDEHSLPPVNHTGGVLRIEDSTAVIMMIDGNRNISYFF